MKAYQSYFKAAWRKAIFAGPVAVALSAMQGGAAMAQSTDALIEGAKLCTRQLPRYEREYGIPTHLLSAIASTESGRYHKGLKIKVPWPWTINADGEGYFFDSKAQAIAMVRKLQARGVKSIDIGCMQVNLMHHPQAFSSLEEAFDPEHNVAYAASFLRSIYQEESSWKKAAAYYHSRMPSRGGEYVGHVYKSWYNIVDKLRMAQVSVPKSSIIAMNDMKNASEGLASSKSDTPYGATKVYNAGQRNASSGVKVARLPEQQGHRVASYHAPRMNSIQVTSADDQRTDRGVMVVTPDIKVVDDTNGAAMAANIPVSSASAQAPRIIHVAQASSAPVSTIAYTSDEPAPSLRSSPDQSPKVNARRSGPNFIFQ